MNQMQHMHYMSRSLYLATISTLAALFLGVLATSPALAQEAQQAANTQNPQQTPADPEEVTLTGTVQSEETRFVLDRFFLVDEQSGVDRTLASLGPDEGGVVLSELVGERVRITGIPQTRGNPPSDFENFNEVPVLITSLEVLEEGSTQDNSSVQDPANCTNGTRAVGYNSGFTGCVPVEELCDADTLTPSQYAECTAPREEITAGGSGGGQGTSTGAAAQGNVLSDQRCTEILNSIRTVPVTKSGEIAIHEDFAAAIAQREGVSARAVQDCEVRYNAGNLSSATSGYSASKLPDTGGLDLPILVGGLTLILGGLVLRKRMS